MRSGWGAVLAPHPDPGLRAKGCAIMVFLAHPEADVPLRAKGCAIMVFLAHPEADVPGVLTDDQRLEVQRLTSASVVVVTSVSNFGS